jgi:hypothetical protein
MRRRLIVRREKVFDIEFLETLPTLVDAELILKLRKEIPADHGKGFSPCYSFEMVNVSSTKVMGGITFELVSLIMNATFAGISVLMFMRSFAATITRPEVAGCSCRLLRTINSIRFG